MNFLLSILALVVLARVFGELFERLGIPSLLGELSAGILLGPAILGLIEVGPLANLAILGIILLLFLVGFNFNIDKLRERGKRGAVISILGFLFVLIPSYFIFKSMGMSLINAIFFSLIMGGESTPNTIRALIDMKQIRSEVAATIISATVVEDIIFYTILALSAGLVGTATFGQYGIAIGKVFAFFLLFIVMERLSPLVIKYSEKMRTDEAQFAVGFVLILFLSYFADVLGFAAVTGAFFAGIALSYSPYLKTGSFTPKMAALTYGVFAPLFFAWMGLQITPGAFAVSRTVVLLIGIGLLGKFVGNWLGGVLTGLGAWRSVGAGIGLSARGGEQLLILVIAAQLGIFGDFVSTILIPVTIVTMLLTIFISPLLLKMFFRYEPQETPA